MFISTELIAAHIFFGFAVFFYIVIRIISPAKYLKREDNTSTTRRTVTYVVGHTRTRRNSNPSDFYDEVTIVKHKDLSSTSRKKKKKNNNLPTEATSTEAILLPPRLQKALERNKKDAP